MKDKFFLIFTCVLEALYGIISMHAAVMLNSAANTVESAGTTGELLRVGLPAIGFGIVYAGSRAAADSVTQLYADRRAKGLREKLSRAVFSMNSEEFAGQDTGEYLNTITGDVLLVRDQYDAQLPMMVCYSSQFIFCVIYSVYLNPAVAAVLMGMSVIQYFTPLLFGKRINELMMVQSEKTAGFTSKFKELLLGFSVIKSYGGEESVEPEFNRSNEEMTKARERAALMKQLMMNTNLLIGWTMILLSVVVTGYFVVKGTMQAGSILTVFYIANRYSMPVMDFAAAYTSVRGSKGVRRKLDAFLEEHPVRTPVKSVPIRRGLTLENVSFAYEGADKLTLDQVSCTFEAGKKYLLLGESGCGKSTLLKVLAGQYQAQGILVDGVPLKQQPYGALHGRMILVGQQPYVFRRTVADNIDFLHTGDRKRLKEAAEKCCLTDFLSTLPRGIDTMVDEEQRQLSGGQKARIGLARAVYAEPDVLLLDEVTSALDPQTALEIEQMILKLPDTLVIHVAHKPSPGLLSQYDAVLRMDAGRLIC